MSFQTGLSGLAAASRNLDVIGNNIANANTPGMKSSRAEFSNMVASAIGTGAGSEIGIGVEVATVAQITRAPSPPPAMTWMWPSTAAASSS
jgi:flagellar hook protein FlgE